VSRDDAGSATIWMVAVIAVVAMVTGVVLSVGTVMVERHRAAIAADEAALAVAAAALDGATGACARGSQIARLDGAELSRCELADAIAVVETRIELPGWLAQFGSAVGRARAGPSSAR
jgi:secretion/DNA translocation related TadE-like protein